MGTEMSEQFLDEVKHAIAVYKYAREEVHSATPSRVLNSFRSTARKTEELVNQIARLSDTEWSLYDDSCEYLDEGGKYQTGRDWVSINRIQSDLHLFANALANGISKIEKIPMQGAMPNYAERILATKIAMALVTETKRTPVLTRGGKFEKVLIWALDLSSVDVKPYSDVMHLMRYAKAALRSD
jgi:hypothetical protein